MVIANTPYPIQTDYRAGIAYCTKLLSGGMTMQEFYAIWFPVDRPTDFSAAQVAVNTFYRCGAEVSERSASALVYSFVADREAIIAAFQREYGIDLTTAKLHWWRFSALLHGLLGHSFTERVQYRLCDPSEIKNKEMRARYQRFQQYYALDEHGRQRKQPQNVEEYNELLLRRARGEA